MSYPGGLYAPSAPTTCRQYSCNATLTLAAHRQWQTEPECRSMSREQGRGCRGRCEGISSWVANGWILATLREEPASFGRAEQRGQSLEGKMLWEGNNDEGVWETQGGYRGQARIQTTGSRNLGIHHSVSIVAGRE
jgi:hypothetical protein